MLTAAKINELKSEVKQLMNKRTGYGSVATYGSSQYDFSEVPTEGSKVLTEHGQKTVDLILKINSYSGLKNVVQDDVIPNAFNNDLVTYVKNLRNKPLAGSANDCSAYCTGLCTSTCTGTCAGTCTGSCTGTCTGTCTGSCTGSCTGTCTGTCTADCANNCSGASYTYSSYSNYSDHPYYDYSNFFGSYANNSMFSNYHNPGT